MLVSLTLPEDEMAVRLEKPIDVVRRVQVRWRGCCQDPSVISATLLSSYDPSPSSPSFINCRCGDHSYEIARCQSADDQFCRAPDAVGARSNVIGQSHAVSVSLLKPTVRDTAPKTRTPISLGALYSILRRRLLKLRPSWRRMATLKTLLHQTS